ncbi:MAG: hypothetical protein WCA44_10250 [Acidobacteriaceae bacterium]
MKRKDSFRMFLVVLFAGIATGVWTPHSWYPTAVSAHVTQATLVR